PRAGWRDRGLDSPSRVHRHALRSDRHPQEGARDPQRRPRRDPPPARQPQPRGHLPRGHQVIAAERTIAPASALRILLYLDAHILLNRIRTAARNPLRLIFWLIFILVILSSIQARTMMNEAIRARPAAPPCAGPLAPCLDL